MDLPKTTYNIVSNNSDIIMHFRYMTKGPSYEVGEMRCLSLRGSETEDAGDRTGKLAPIIKVPDEQTAMAEILACFEGGSPRRVVKKKVIKKSVKKTFKRKVLPRKGS